MLLLMLLKLKYINKETDDQLWTTVMRGYDTVVQLVEELGLSVTTGSYPLHNCCPKLIICCRIIIFKLQKP